ncbi:TetR/AcrR family transcriptional regulator [Lacrimispora aerotolerans]|uniref:TetR/AcrR family transcriptional regulator n=1 Tax=Lacrimispora aerotolerans TaxID=36832 RepID=UPI000479E206|nr:TetR/AcrR family transcriptional regulator [Lacrimispora aerotolerans]
MSAQKNNTRQELLDAGMQEFMKYGYEGASLRRIAKEASVTTGAIYGYFPSKEALFDELTGEAADGLLEMYLQAHKEFAKLPPELQANALDDISDESAPAIVNYVYDRFDIFKLLFLKSSTGWCDSYLDQLAEIEEASSWEFIKVMKSLGHEVMDIDSTLIHIISRSFFLQLLEFVSHDVPREKALSYASALIQFQHAGWKKIMGL